MKSMVWFSYRRKFRHRPDSLSASRNMQFLLIIQILSTHTRKHNLRPGCLTLRETHDSLACCSAKTSFLHLRMLIHDRIAPPTQSRSSCGQLETGRYGRNYYGRPIPQIGMDRCTCGNVFVFGNSGNCGNFWISGYGGTHKLRKQLQQ